MRRRVRCRWACCGSFQKKLTPPGLPCMAKWTPPKGRVAHAAMLCGSLSPYSVLARGYSIARKAGSVLKSSADASEGDRVEVQLAAGRLGCRVETILQRKSYEKKEMTFEAAGTELDAILADFPTRRRLWTAALCCTPGRQELIAFFATKHCKKAQITIDEIDAKNAGKQE